MRRIEWMGASVLVPVLLLNPAVLHAEAELETVRAMLKLDAEEALARERARLPRPRTPAAPPVRRDGVEVAAIYGLAGSRTAVLRVNDERREYREGSEWARGHPASPREYRLVKIEQSCVHLAKSAGGAFRVACFVPASGDEAGRPPRAADTRGPAALGMPLLSRGLPR